MERMKHYLKKFEDQIHQRPNEPALCDYQGASYTYKDVATLIEEYHRFFNAVGIQKGDKIALCARNSARWAIMFLAVNTYGAVIVPILPNYLAPGIAQLIRHSDSQLLLTDPELWAQLSKESLPQIRAVVSVKENKILWSEDQEIVSAWEQREVKNLKPSKVSYKVDSDSVAIINYTSGTSGDPKGVMLTYGAMSDIVEYCQEHIYNGPETIISMLPLAHIYGLAMEFIYPCCTGFTIYFLGKTPSPSLLMKSMQEIRPYLVITVPLIMEKIHANWIKPHLSSRPAKAISTVPYVRLSYYKSVGKKVMDLFGGRVNTIIIGGAPLSWKVESDLKKIGLPYVVGYGLTEGCPLLSIETPLGFAPGSCGKPIHEIRIDSSDPERVPGEIQSRGPNLFVGYYKNPEADAAAHTADGWFRTGDLGVMDIEGNLFIRGRIKSLILSASGQNIYPEEIEQELSAHPMVEDSLVLDRGGKIIALVYPKSGVAPHVEKEEDLNFFCEEIRNTTNKLLPAFSQIFRVELVDVPFERTAKGTIKRHLYQ